MARSIAVALTLPVALSLVRCAPPPEVAPAPAPAVRAAPAASPAETAAAVITEESLRRDVLAISDDRFAGRGPGTPGDAAARAWLADQLAALGYEPGVGDSWEQRFAIVGVTAKIPKTWSFTRGGERLDFRWWDEFIAASGVQQPKVSVTSAEVVFAGYGIVAPEEDWNDFEGADVKGKVLLLLNDDPSHEPDLFGGERRLYYGRWTYKYESAARQGAAGAIIIHTDASAGYPWRVVQTSWQGEQADLPAGDEPRTPIHGWLTEDAARRLVALGGHDLDALVAKANDRAFSPISLGVTTSLAFDVDLRKSETANVVGLLRGSELPDEAVVFSAHHDHLGKREGEGDTTYNGARDNGAGIAEALAVARAFAALPAPPRRSVAFAFVGAEEQGLLGSKFYAANPTIELSNIAANVNFELGNIWGPTNDVVVHGKGKTTLDPFLEAAAAAQGRRVEEAPNPRAGWYYRSDQFSFARAGVPALWFESGRDFVDRPLGWGNAQVDGWIARHYHQPSDEVTDEWRFDGMVLDARLAFAVGLAIANAEEKPSWTPGDEFERAGEAR